MPLVVVEQTAMTVTSQEQPDATIVACEGVAHSMPLAAQVTAPNVGRAELDGAVAASDRAAQFAPSEAQMEVVMTVTNPAG
jgi:G3E family GTPase